MTTIRYDVVNEAGESRSFTTDDAERMIKEMFIDAKQYRFLIESVPGNTEIDIQNKEDCITNRAYLGRPNKFNPAQKAIVNEALVYKPEGLPFTFEEKITNFYARSIAGSTGILDLQMFDFYWNGMSDLFLKPTGMIQKHQLPVIDPGMLVVRVYSYVIKNNVPVRSHTDVVLHLHKTVGLYDPQFRFIPPIFDEAMNRARNSDSDNIYLLGLNLRYFCLVFNKLAFLSKQKEVLSIKTYLIKNAASAALYDARIVSQMNSRYQTENSLFIRIVPAIIPYSSKSEHGTETYASRFFKLFPEHTEHNAYSYSDVISSGSGTDNNNRIKLDDYERVIRDFNLQEIVFTNEKNTNDGLFSWVSPDLAKMISSTDGTTATISLDSLNDHMISIDYEKKVYKTALKGSLDFNMLDSKKSLIECKKFNQRFKLANSRTYLYSDFDSDNTKLITKELTDNLFFHRNVNYMKDVKTVNDYARNALVAFVDNDIELPELNDLINMPVEKLNEFFYSLRGISCEGFFTREFLKQHMVVQRTERLKLMLADTDIKFQDLVHNKNNYLHRQFDYRNDLKDQFLIREYKNCTCGGKIIHGICRYCNNPKPLDSEIYKEYWVDFNKDFSSVVIKDIKITDEGINFYLNYYLPNANARFKCDLLSKLVPVETSQAHIGKITSFSCGDVQYDNVDIPLDGIYFGLGGFKSKTHGIPFAVLRLYNALRDQVIYSSEDCLNKTDEINQFLSTFKKSKVRTKIYDRNLKKYVYKTVDAWVGLVAVSPTEVSQEFNKTKTEIEKSFSKANYALYELLGFTELNKAMAAFNQKTVESNDIMYRKYLKVVKYLNAKAPFNPQTDEEIAKVIAYDALLGDEKKFNNIYRDIKAKGKLFNITNFENLVSKQMITYEEYKNIINSHPLFAFKEFEKGFYITFNVSTQDPGLINSPDVKNMSRIQYPIYFPDKFMLMNMFEFIGDNNIRINDLLSEYFNVFQTLCTSKFGVEYNLVSINNVPISYANTNGALLKACYNELFNKEGLINKITGIALPRVMSKQLTDIDCPFDVAIISNKHQYRTLASKYFNAKFPDREQDWTEDYNKETGTYDNLGWCWTEDMYCIAIREPNLFTKQNLNIKKVWSLPRANVEYRNLYAYSFQQKHPNPRGIYLNSVFVVFNLEGDTDGDLAFLGVPHDVNTQEQLAIIWEQIKDFKFFDIDNENPNAKLVRQSYLIPSLSYLLDEAENLNFKLDKLEIGYTEIPFERALAANFDAARNKSAIGFLTVSLWYVTYFLDFYIHNYEYFKSKYDVPLLTSEDKYDLLFIFQYLLTQQNGVRAMKDDGSYGKLTYSALIKNELLNKPARDLFIDLINDYKAVNKEHGIEVDYSECVNKLFQIFDNLFISHFNDTDKEYTLKQGFGFALDTYNKPTQTGDYRIISYLDPIWSYHDQNTPKGRFEKLDCSNLLDPYFLDFEAMFLVFYGRSLARFTGKFGYDPVMKILGFVNKEHLNTPLLKYYSNVFKK